MAAAKTQVKTPPPPAGEEHDPKTGEIIEHGPKAAVSSATAEGGAVVAPDDAGAVVAADEYAGYAEDAGAGFENQTAADYAIPYIRVLHTQSPEVVAHAEEENSPYRGGMIINSTRQTLYPGKVGMDFIPVTTEHKFVEFVPRDKGGGFVDQYQIDDPLILKCQKEQPFGDYTNPANGNDITETFNLFMLELDGEGNPAPAVFAFTSTMIRSYREFMTRARNLVLTLPDGRKITKLPLFSHAYRMRSERKEKSGNVWWVPTIAFAGDTAPESRVSPSSNIYKMAKEMREAVLAGRMKAATETLKAEGDAAPAKGDTAAEDAPY